MQGCWKDANGNGAVDSGELMTMAQAGITAIDIRGNELVPDGRWISNNEIIESGTVTYDGNETGRIYEVFFEMRLADAVANDNGADAGNVVWLDRRVV